MAHALGHEPPQWDRVDAHAPDVVHEPPKDVVRDTRRSRRAVVDLSSSSSDDLPSLEEVEYDESWTRAPIPWTPFSHVHLDDVEIPLDVAAKHRWNETTAANPHVIRRLPGARDLQHFPWITEHERHDVTLSTVLKHPMTQEDQAAFPEPAPRVFSFTRRNDPSRAQIFQTTFVGRDDTCKNRDKQGGAFVVGFAKQLRKKHFTCGARRPADARKYALHVAMPIRTLFQTVLELKHRPKEGATTLWEMVNTAHEEGRSYLMYESTLADHAHLFQVGTEAPQTPYIFPRAVALQSSTWQGMSFHVSLATHQHGHWMDWTRDAVWTDHGLSRQDGNPWRRVRVRVPSASATSVTSTTLPRAAKPMVNTKWARVRPEELLVYETDRGKDEEATPHNYLDLWLSVGPDAKLGQALDDALPLTSELRAKKRETLMDMGSRTTTGTAPSMLARVVSTLFVPLMQHGMAYSVQTALANDPTWRREFEAYVPHRLELAAAPDAMTMDDIPDQASSSEADSDLDAKLDAYDRRAKKHEERPLKTEAQFWSHVATMAITKQGQLKVDQTYARERLSQAVAYLDPERHLMDTRRMALVLRPDLPGGMAQLKAYLQRVRRKGKGTTEYMRYFVDTFDVGASLAFLFHRIVIQ